MKRFLLAILLCLLAACDKPVQFNAIDITGQDYGAALKLADSSGAMRSLADFKGKVSAVFFGYTQCPDACPTTLSLLKDVRQRLGADGDRLQVVFVTLDPERDTPDMLGAYTKAFDASFIGLRGDAAQTQAVAKAFKVFYEKRGDVAGGHYTLDHTAGIYLFDPQGRTRLFERYGEQPERVLADIKLLLAGH